MKRYLAIAALLLWHCSAYTYWVDKTCTSRTGWKDMLDEARSMATKANERLNKDSDTDFAAVFKRLFKTDKGDGTLYKKSDETVPEDQNHGQKPFDFVTTILKEISTDQQSSKWQEADQNSEEARRNSDIRFYCDNDSDQRWKTINQGGQPKAMVDLANMMKRGVDKPPYCRQSGNKLGVTYRGRMPPQSDKARYPDQNSNRVTVTICDNAFNNPAAQQPPLPDNLKGIPVDADLGELKDGIRALGYLVSFTILHEWTHSEPYKTVDVDYGWDKIMVMDVNDSLNNADTYCFFAIWALLADRNKGDGGGFTLPRLGNGKSPAAIKAEEDAKNGLIKLYKSITKRWEDLIARAWRA